MCKVYRNQDLITIRAAVFERNISFSERNLVNSTRNSLRKAAKYYIDVVFVVINQDSCNSFCYNTDS